MLDVKFEILVKTALIKKNMTLTELANKIGISVSYLSDIVRGNRQGISHKKKICEILGIKYEK